MDAENAESAETPQRPRTEELADPDGLEGARNGEVGMVCYAYGCTMVGGSRNP